MNTVLILVILSLVSFLLLLFFNWYYKKYIFYYSQEAHIQRGLLNKYDMVAYGSSYARYAFAFKAAGVNGYNMGFAAQFFYYTEKMIKQYQEIYNKGCQIVIVVPDLVFAETGKGIYGSERYIHILNKDVLEDEYSLTHYIREVLFPVFCHPRLVFTVVKNIAKKLLHIPTINPYVLEKNQLDENQTLEAAHKRCNSWCKQFGLKDTYTDDVDSSLEMKFVESRKILTRMIQWCVDNQYRPVLVVTPFSAQLNSITSEQFIKKVLYDNIRLANIQNIPVLDYLRDERFQNYKLYLNSADLLNLAGRRAFTKVLVEDLKKLK